MRTVDRNVASVQAIMIGSGWEDHGPAGASSTAGLSHDAASCRRPGCNVTRRLAKVPLSALCPHGFIFIWAAKQDISAVFRLLGKLGFMYVENLTWVLLHANGSVLHLPEYHTKRSHVTLFIFRKASTLSHR